MSKPFFSLITPVYNIEKLLPKTIESALEQTFTDWEMILVDDGSPDNAGMICDQYAAKDSRISVVHKKNEGLAAARNTGIKACKGKFFLILEGSDLLVNEHTLEDIYNDLMDKDVDIYFARLQDVIEKGWQVTGIQQEYCVDGIYDKGGKSLFVKLTDNEDILALSSPVNKLFRTEFVKENNLWFYPGIYHDDDEWIPRTIALSKKCFFTKRIIYNALTWDGCLGLAVSDNSIMKKSCDKMLIALHCCEDIDDRFPEENTEFKKKFYEYYVRMFMGSIADLNMVNDEECRNQIEKSIIKYKKVLSYAKKCNSRNVVALGFAYDIFGIGVAEKMILARYSK